MKTFLEKLFGKHVSKDTPPELSTKEKATANKEPYITVVKTHVDPDNIKNGFFELDWNEYFVSQLCASGYFGESDEDIVSKWFTDLCKTMGDDNGIDMARRGSGLVDIDAIRNGDS